MAPAKRVLLTGAAGFVGSQLARLLVREGHQVSAIMKPETDRWRIADVEDAIEIIDGDIRNAPLLVDRLRAVRPDMCLHLAWHGWSGKTEVDENLSSLSASLDLLRTMPAISCPRLVTVGTCFEYDLDLASDRLTETTPLRPRELYGISKKAFYEVAQQYSALTGVSVATARLFYTYGPFEDARKVVPSVVLALLRGEAASVTPGAQVRDFLHVTDIASAIWHVATSDVTGAVNVASGEPVTIADLATRIGRLVGRPELVRLGAVEYRPGEPMRVLADAAMLRQRLGWTPRFDLDRGLADTVKWWESRR